MFDRVHGTVDDLLAAADSICSHSTPIFVATYAAEHELARTMQRMGKGRLGLRGFVVSGRSPYLIQVPWGSRPSRAAGKCARGFLWETDEGSLVHLLALKEDFRFLIGEFRHYLLTDLTQVYLQTTGFESCFDSLRSCEALSAISVTDYTAWVMTDESKRAETRRVWLPAATDHAEFFDKLKEEDQRLRSLGLIVAQTDGARGRVRRDITFSCESGFRLFYDTIISSLRRLAAANRGIFLKRGASESPTRTPRPLQVNYASPIFEDKRQNHRLIAVLRKLPDSALSVFHPNPYLHASVIDYADGSSYALWITDNSTITIVPEFKASAGSLERLCNHIAEWFGEGVIQEIPA